MKRSPASGFDEAAVDAAFFQDGRVKSNVRVTVAGVGFATRAFAHALETDDLVAPQNARLPSKAAKLYANPGT